MVTKKVRFEGRLTSKSINIIPYPILTKALYDKAIDKHKRLYNGRWGHRGLLLEVPYHFEGQLQGQTQTPLLPSTVTTCSDMYTLRWMTDYSILGQEDSKNQTAFFFLKNSVVREMVTGFINRNEPTYTIFLGTDDS